MRTKLSLKKLITPPLPLTLLLLSVGFFPWILFYINGLGLNIDSSELKIVPGFFSLTTFKNNQLPYLLNIAFTIFNSILIIQLNNKFSLIRTRTLMPIFIFNLLLGAWFQTHMLFRGHVAVTIFLLAFFAFFEMYRNRNATEQAFLTTFLIALSSILIKPLLLLLPIFWIGFVQFQSFSLRTWLASLIGIITPWIIYLALGFYFQPSLLNPEELLSGFIPTFTLAQRPLYELIYLGAISIIFLIALGGMFQNLRSDSIQTRSRLRFLTVFTIAIFLLTLFSKENYNTLMPLAALGYSLLFSHPLSLRPGNFFSIVFIIFVLLNFAYIISSLIL